MINDFFLIFYWGLLLSGLGLIFLPLTWRFFGRFFDQGYALSKIIGLLIVSYLIWLWGSLKILPFTNTTIWLAIILSLIFNLWLIRKEKKKFKQTIKANWKIFVFEEILFFIALTSWAYVRGFQPSIQGLEKFMDYGFVNSILRTRFFPPTDMWLSGQTINYYYFGHLVSAILTKLSQLDPAITYNLMIATLFSLSFTAGFSLGANLLHSLKIKLKKAVFGGLASAALLTLGGNLHSLYWWLTNQGFAGYWYPDATRFIVEKFGALDNTIHEFPIYSFVVADLHGHLINLPFVLFFISLMFSFFIKNLKLNIKNLILPALMLGVFFMTNAWDLPIYLLLLGLVVLYTTKNIQKTFLLILPIIVLTVIFSLPFHLQFQNISDGVALTEFHSPLKMLLTLWGFPLIISISLVVFLIKKQKPQLTDKFILILLTIAWFLILLPEAIYVKDIYIHSYQRANTMFKLTYQSFVMFSFCAGYTLLRISSGLKKKLSRFLYVTLNLFFLIFIFIYPSFAIKAYYGLTDYQGLYGLDYLKRAYPDDYQAINWLRSNVVNQPVILEAVGESYTDFARVSANTGLPTILGWRVHEWLWRGSFDIPGQRTEIVKEIYESENLNKTKALLNQYQIDYIFVGNLEKTQYPKLNEEKFTDLGEITFSSGETKIYKIDN